MSHPSAPPKQGLLLVRSRITDPSFSTTQYRNWTRLHFKDLLDLPAQEAIPNKNKNDPIQREHGPVTQTLRFSAPKAINGKEGNEEQYPYLNTIYLNDLSVLMRKGYEDVTRRLDIDNTRALAPIEIARGITPVGREGMVFEVVEARFAVYERIGGEGDGVVVASGVVPVSVCVDAPVGEDGEGVEEVVVGLVGGFEGEDMGFGMRARMEGFRLDREAQPLGHPKIEGVSGFLVLLFVEMGRVGGDRPELGEVAEGVGRLVERWEKELPAGTKIEKRVWDLETAMGAGKDGYKVLRDT